MSIGRGVMQHRSLIVVVVVIAVVVVVVVVAVPFLSSS
jgi:hypothetical protein